MTTKNASARRPPAPAPEPCDALRLDRFLPYRLSVAANRVSRAIADRYEREFDLSIPEWRVLAVLAREPGATASALVAATAMDKVAISRAVKRLAAMNRVSSVPDDADARRLRLSLTENGQSLYARIAPLALDYERKLLQALGPANAAGLDKALDRLLAAVAE